MIIGLAIANGLMGQSGSNPSISVHVFTNALGSADNPAAISRLTNIGQSTHQFYGKLTVCDPASNTAYISMYANTSDGKFGTLSPLVITTLPIVLAGTATNTSGVVNATGSGVFPVLIIAAQIPVGCTFNLYYTGTLFGASIGIQQVVVSDTNTIPLATQGTKFFNAPNALQYPTMIAASSEAENFPTSSDRNVGNVVACNKSIAVSVNAGATVELLAGTAAVAIHICSMAFSGSIANTSFQIISGTATTTPCDTTPVVQVGTMLIGTTPFTFGNGLGHVVRGPTAKALCLAATTGNVTGVISYARFVGGF